MRSKIQTYAKCSYHSFNLLVNKILFIHRLFRLKASVKPKKIIVMKDPKSLHHLAEKSLL